MTKTTEKRYLDQIDNLVSANVRMKNALLEIGSIQVVAGEPWTDLNRAPMIAREAIAATN